MKLLLQTRWLLLLLGCLLARGQEEEFHADEDLGEAAALPPAMPEGRQEPGGGRYKLKKEQVQKQTQAQAERLRDLHSRNKAKREEQKRKREG